MSSVAPSPAESFDAQVDRIIAHVPQWAQAKEILVAPLPDVISLNNMNYRVSVDGGTYVLRVAAPAAAEIGVRRDAEGAAARAAAQAGIGPEVVYYDDDGHMVTRFINGRHWQPHEFLDPANVTRIAQTLRRLHAIKGVQADGSVFNRIGRLLASAAGLGAQLPPNLDAHLAMLGRIEAQRAADTRFRPGLSHNDFWANNFLDDGRRLWLVDWEFSGDGDGLFDLATISLSAKYSAAQQAMLLQTYGSTDPGDLQQLQTMNYVVWFFEGAWALVQHQLRGTAGYDFQSHAQRMFAALNARLEG